MNNPLDTAKFKMGSRVRIKKGATDRFGQPLDSKYIGAEGFVKYTYEYVYGNDGMQDKDQYAIVFDDLGFVAWFDEDNIEDVDWKQFIMGRGIYL